MSQSKAKTGKVEFFNNKKGWGKIVSNCGKEFFIHHRDIVDPKFFPDGQLEKFRTLARGQFVSFEVQESGKPMDSAVGLIILKDNNGPQE